MRKLLRKYFGDSETILWARLQAGFGLLAAGMAAVDPSMLQMLLTPRAFAIYLFANGVITEIARRHRAKDL